MISQNTVQLPDFTLLGAGLVGSLLAVFLKKRGYEVVVYERRSDPRVQGAYAGRSINLALSARGIQALKKVGIDQEVLSNGMTMNGRTMHSTSGDTTYQAYGKEGEHIYSVSRGGLNQKLMSLAEREGARLYFDEKCIQVDPSLKHIVIEQNQEPHIRKQAYHRLIGTDGAYSALRDYMMRSDRFDYSQDYLPHGYKELTIPPTADGSFALSPDSLHIWPRGTYMMIALPNPDRTFTCTLFFPFEGKPSFSSLKDPNDILGFFQQQFPDALALMPELVDEYLRNPTSSLVTVRCAPWNMGSDHLLMGDSAHAIVPFYGQGMNCGFEDVRLFDELIDEYHQNWDLIFPEFGARRKANADAIADLAKANFIEMRDKVADPDFLLRKRIEARINQIYPSRWTPLYSMVTFCPDIPYSTALLRGKIQDEWMDRLMQQGNWHRDFGTKRMDDAIAHGMESYNEGL
jgi:kynurenine 3-monooxygenase